ncbi:MAG: electron transfer flavoprotein beta subunit/FixA family protein [Bacteroidales bacterium]|nr:electron transfer flavoprotein beta subunit/FixA family protein [Bacteroidales bacterium]MBR2051592.1 electron transfer flavoprotein beta subunit/FixA family protein [Bacteroidales bacterium]
MNNKEFQIVVLAKQVPDTHNVGKDAMKEDGTINRAALPAIFNPDDLKALEMALACKDALKNIMDVKVSVITMGPSRAADIVRESIFRGADNGFVVSDKRFAGSDTLATSYALSAAVKKLGHIDIVFSGRQAIDGDTAQVGPQVAEKLNIPQVTYAEELVSLTENEIVIKRRLDRGVETVKATFPVLVTVHGNANDCRPRHAARLLTYKKACSVSEIQSTDNGLQSTDIVSLWEKKPYLKIEEWTADDINPDFDRLGLNGSPTKVKSIENVVLTSKENKKINNSESEINDLMKELITAHII